MFIPRRRRLLTAHCIAHAKAEAHSPARVVGGTRKNDVNTPANTILALTVVCDTECVAAASASARAAEQRSPYAAPHLAPHRTSPPPPPPARRSFPCAERLLALTGPVCALAVPRSRKSVVREWKGESYCMACAAGIAREARFYVPPTTFCANRSYLPTHRNNPQAQNTPA